MSDQDAPQNDVPQQGGAAADPQDNPQAQTRAQTRTQTRTRRIPRRAPAILNQAPWCVPVNPDAPVEPLTEDGVQALERAAEPGVVKVVLEV